ncbi:MAG: diaminopimelate epimerase [Candidatus Lambdaproteobacteria bacterium]|nr:diaminopimelate epimerase [Candidatus Lambdaproteobacteria bacterium]
MPDFYKYHGLGNDYLVLEPARFEGPPTPEAIRLICDRNRGLGSDGILWGPAPLKAKQRAAATPGVRIYNPDGSEGEKSGNGLRIFARHLWARRLVESPAFAIDTIGGRVQARVLDRTGGRIRIGMGRVRFESAAIPWSGPPREALGKRLNLGGETLILNGATLGNPHCVVFVEEPSEALARRLGPLLETHPLFPNRTNVQFAQALDPHRLKIEIWERGAGHTLASGSSSCAAAAVACRLGLCRSPVTVEMPGGALRIEIDRAYHVAMEGEVQAVGNGRFAAEFLRALGLRRARRG